MGFVRSSANSLNISIQTVHNSIVNNVLLESEIVSEKCTKVMLTTPCLFYAASKPLFFCKFEYPATDVYVFVLALSACSLQGQV